MVLPPALPPSLRAAVLVIKLGQSEEGERPWEEMKLFFTMARQHVRLESGGRVGRGDIELMEMPRTISISSSATAPVGRGRSVDETIEMNQKEVGLAATNRDLLARRKADMIAARTPFLSSRSRRHQRNSDDGHGLGRGRKNGPSRVGPPSVMSLTKKIFSVKIKNFFGRSVRLR